MQDRTAELLDKQAIQELVTTYGAALDDRDWKRLEGCFVSDGSARYGTAAGFQQGFPAIVALCRGILERLDASHHLISNVAAELRDDTARCRCLFQAQHVRHGAEGGALYVMGGEYHDALRRTDAGWQIQQREIRLVWQDGNPAVLNG